VSAWLVSASSTNDLSRIFVDLDVVGAIVQASVDDEDFLMVERVEIPAWKLGLLTWSDNRSAVCMTRRLDERDSTPVADVLCLIFLFLNTEDYLVNSITKNIFNVTPDKCYYSISIFFFFLNSNAFIRVGINSKKTKSIIKNK